MALYATIVHAARTLQCKTPAPVTAAADMCGSLNLKNDLAQHRRYTLFYSTNFHTSARKIGLYAIGRSDMTRAIMKQTGLG
jgi:hypothetical protein